MPDSNVPAVSKGTMVVLLWSSLSLQCCPQIRDMFRSHWPAGQSQTGQTRAHSYISEWWSENDKLSSGQFSRQPSFFYCGELEMRVIFLDLNARKVQIFRQKRSTRRLSGENSEEKKQKHSSFDDSSGVFTLLFYFYRDVVFYLPWSLENWWSDAPNWIGEKYFSE